MPANPNNQMKIIIWKDQLGSNHEIKENYNLERSAWFQ